MKASSLLRSIALLSFIWLNGVLATSQQRRLQDDASITVVVQTDQAPDETSWILFDSNTGVLVQQVALGSYLNPNSFESLTLSVTEGHSYTLQLLDSVGNGICCSNGEGSATIYFGTDASANSVLAVSNGQYGSHQFLTFEASSNGTQVFAPSESPSMQPTDTMWPTSIPTTSAAPSIPVVTVVITVAILTDRFPEEISWRLVRDSDGVIIHEVPQGIYSTPSVQELTTVLTTEGDIYTLFLQDSASDGICCFHGSGEARVFLGFPDTSPLAYSRGDYGFSIALGFLASGSGVISVPPPAPVPAPLVPATSCQGIPLAQDGCSICGPGMCVGNPDAIFTFPGQPPVPCDLIEQVGLQGIIPPEDCLLIPPLAAGVCDCQPAPPSVSPPVASTSLCPAVPSGGCSVCGSGMCVGNPDGIFAFPGQPNYFCGELEQIGANGGIPLDQCPFLPGLIFDLCDCGLNTIPPSSSPVAQAGSCPAVPGGGCSICGPGMCVGNPDSVLAFPAQPPVPCGVLEDAGLDGQIPLDVCLDLPNLIDESCGCRSDGIPPPMAPPVAPATMVCPAVSSGGCSVCGSGRCVGNPNGIFAFPGQPFLSCGELELVGASGDIPLDQCPFLPGIIVDMCECRPGATPPSSSPPAMSPTSCPAVPGGGCSICGPGKCVGSPDAIFAFPGQPMFLCSELQDAGFDGLIPFDQCLFLPELIGDLCDCRFGETLPSVSPFAAPPVIASPLVFVGLDACKSSPCGICEGDCDTDIECGAGLKCFSRRTVSDPLPPGCFDSGSFSFDDLDFCYDDSTPPITPPAFVPTDPPFTMAPIGSPPMAPTNDMPLVFVGPLLPPSFFSISIAPVTESSSPLPPTSCPPIPTGACAVCGADKCVTRPNEIIVTPGQPSLSCGQLEQDGIDFLIPSSICSTVFEDISHKCGCQARIEQGAQSETPEAVATEAPAQPAATEAPAAPDAAPPAAMEAPMSSRVPKGSKKEKGKGMKRQ